MTEANVSTAKVNNARLTNYHKEMIAANVCKAAEHLEREAQIKASKDLTNQAYPLFYSEQNRKMMAAAPSGAFRLQQFKVNAQGYSIDLDDNVLVFAKDYYERFSIDAHKHPELVEAMRKYGSDKAALPNVQKVRREKLIAALSGFTTWRALAIGWPELWQTIAHLCPADKQCTALAIPIADLNAEYGLPRVGEGV